MSSKLALSQLKSLTQDNSGRPEGDKSIRKAIRKKRRSSRRQAQKQQQQQQQQREANPLAYYQATASAQKATADLMSKVGWCLCEAVATLCSTQLATLIYCCRHSCVQLLGQAAQKEDSDSDLDLDPDF